MKIHINYANNRYYNSQKRCSLTAIQDGGFDATIPYNFLNLDQEFVNKNAWCLSQHRGAGYWIWKPYLISKTLEKMNDNDWLMYTDSGMFFLRSPWDVILEKEKEITEKGIMTFCTCNKNKVYCKRDAFVLMGLDEEKYTNSEQRLASIFVCKKTNFSVNFVNEWLSYAQDPRIISDLPNTQGLPNYPEFEDHRHDQSIMSLLCIKHDTFLYMKDLTQFSNTDPYIMHNRDPS